MDEMTQEEVYDLAIKAARYLLSKKLTRIYTCRFWDSYYDLAHDMYDYYYSEDTDILSKYDSSKSSLSTYITVRFKHYANKIAKRSIYRNKSLSNSVKNKRLSVMDNYQSELLIDKIPVVVKGDDENVLWKIILSHGYCSGWFECYKLGWTKKQYKETYDSLKIQIKEHLGLNKEKPTSGREYKEKYDDNDE